MANPKASTNGYRKVQAATPPPELQQKQQVVVEPRKSKKVPPPSSPKFSSSSGVDGLSLVNLIARLIAWYALYTVLFRCPAIPTSDSPGICHPAHTIKTALRPHVLPYYNIYLSPYVQQYSPYVQKVNREYIIPAYNTAYVTYSKYGEPYVSKGSKLAAVEYDRYLKPHVETAQSKAESYYIAYVSPHTETANKIWINDVKPTVDIAEKKAEVFWHDHALPNYNKVQPYLATAYQHGKYVITVIVAPVVKEGGEKAVGWGRGVWSEVVRPQVGRIGERLGGTNGSGVPASSVSSSIFSSLAAAKPSGEAASIASISSMIASASAAKASDAVAEPANKLTKEEAKEIIKNDLYTYSEIFSASSLKALTELKSQIDEISDKAMHSKQKAVAKDIADLEKLVEEGSRNLKAEIVTLASRLSSKSTLEEKTAAQEQLFAATRHLGTQIRDKAHLMRKDAEKNLAKVYDAVSEAADQQLEVLDGVNDLGMQELGMKWAWMDWVSYKDWAKYHELKKEMRESRTTIIKSAEDNEKLREITKWVEDEWEGKATDIAKEAAEQLKTIKKVGKKMIELADASEDFTDDQIPVAVKRASQQVLKSADKLKAAFQPEEEEEESVKDKVMDAIDDAKSKIAQVVGGSQISTPVGESIISAASEAVGKATARVKVRVPGGVEAGFVAAAEKVIYDGDDSFIDDVKSRLSEASKAVSQAVQDAMDRATATSEPSAGESIQSRLKELHDSAVYAASSILYGTPTPVTEEMFSVATDKYSAAVAAASSILYGTPTPTHEVLLEQAKLAYIQATDAAMDSFRSAKRLAATHVQPSEKPVKESMYSVASEKYSSTLSAAGASYSSVISVGGEAKKSYDAAIADAQSKLNSAASAALTKVSGTPQPASESTMSVARAKHSKAVTEAQSTYDSWFYAVSTQLYGTTPVIESVLSSASSAASAASATASSVAHAASKGVKDTVTAVSVRAEGVVSAASEQIYGTPAPSGVSASVVSVASQAAESLAAAQGQAQDLTALRYAELQSMINELIHGKEPTFSESVMARFSSVYYGTPTPFLSHASSFAASATSAAVGVAAFATSAAADAAASANSVVAEVAASATSAAAQTIGSMPPAIDEMIQDAVSRVRAVAAEASVVVYGKEPTQFEKYQTQLRKMGQDAVDNVSIAIYGTPKSGFELASETAASFASKASDSAASMVSQASENVASVYDDARDAAASLGVNMGLLEAEKSYKDALMENAKKRIENAVRSAQETLQSVRKAAEEYATQAAEAAQRVRDEL